MSKKEQKTKRWDLARGGTGLLFPRGIKPEPWPEWLPKSFLNIHLLQEDPIVLREELFDGRNTWGPIENLLYSIAREAEKNIQEDPSLLEKANRAARRSEAEFRDLFDWEILTPKQRNAIAALRSVEAIRSKFFYLHESGYYYPCKDDDPTTAKDLLEMILLVLAAMRGELWEGVWQHSERGAAVLRGSKSERLDNLNRVIIRELKAHGLKLSAKEISANFAEEALRDDALCDPNSIVYDVEEDGTICWYDQRKRARKTPFNKLRDRVSRMKKLLRPPV